MSIEARLAEFAEQNDFSTRGALNIGLVISRKAKSLSFPIDPATLLSRRSGNQVAGLNGKAGNRVLLDYGVTQSIGTEVGRTNRDSPRQMRLYVSLLNQLESEGVLDLDAAERFWVDRVVAYFNTKPFILRLDPATSVQAAVRDLLKQAEDRQKSSGGAMIVGTFLQHLVGAKLDVALQGRVEVAHHSANMSDQGRGRGGDFDIEDAAIHVTATPGDLLLEKCRANLREAARPIIITTPDGAELATRLARQSGLIDRIDVLDVAQFVSTNVHELGGFRTSATSQSIFRIVERYNELIDTYQHAPGLKISLGEKSGKKS
jgi:hypothetical protein